MNSSDPVRHFYLWVVLITLLGLFLRTFLLRSQPASIDDYAVGLSAINYMESGQLGPTMWNHPGLRNIFIYFTMELFGSGLLGLKGISVVLGTLCIPLLGLVARRILRNETTALLAALLWAIEPLAIDFSRQAINDIYLAFFPLLGIYLACRYRESGHQAWLIGSGLSFGCGLASKWTAFFPLAVTLSFLSITIWKQTGEAISLRVVRLAHVASLLVLLPLLVYLLTFIPWFGRGYGVAEWTALQQSMYRETSQHTGYHPLAEDHRDHWAYEWFIRPVTFEDMFFTLGKTQAEDPDAAPSFSIEKNITILLAVANPLVWLLVLPATVYLAIRGVRGRDEGLCYLAALFLFSYLPLALATRPIWVDTALSVLPFAIMAVAYLITTVIRRPSAWKRLVLFYSALVVITSIPLYVLVIGQGFKAPILKGYLLRNYAEKAVQTPDSDKTPSERR
jgi:dolichyl-phosphate-mannose--protein O-mannosyl transferase